MHAGEKACWKTILLEGQGVGGCGEAPPSRRQRLATLYRFQNGVAPADVRLVDPRRQAEVTDPAEIDWTHFPVVDALEAVTFDELHRLRSLLRADPPATPGPASPTPPNGLVWGVDLRRAVLKPDA